MKPGLFPACIAALLLLGGPVSAQLGAGLTLPRLDVPQAAGAALGQVDGMVQGIGSLARARLDQVAALIRANPRSIDTDPKGAPVVRGEILATDPGDAALAAAKAVGFEIIADEREAALGLRVVRLRVPAGQSVRSAIKRLRKLDPAGSYEFNHIYSAAGDAAGGAAPVPGSGGARIGLIDGGIAARPGVESRAFAGTGTPSPHAAAVGAILLAAAPGAQLFAADVYGGQPTGGNAAALVHAFGWLAQQRVGVINISLVGPPNAALKAAIAATARRNILIVAPVGNDGPAAPPLYPASWPEVVAVTGVDSNDRLLVEAGRAVHVDFAAPGLALVAAPGVRGTSFAAPVVAGLLARQHPNLSVVNIMSPLASLGLSAVDLGKPGVDPLYGRGLVGREFRTSPKKISSRRD